MKSLKYTYIEISISRQTIENKELKITKKSYTCSTIMEWQAVVDYRHAMPD